MVIRIAIAEDEAQAAKTLKDYLMRYERENQLKFEITAFSNAISLLDHYTAEYDIIFMDIRMPYLNGMDAAQRLRALDQNVLLIFITSLTQYAIAGYEVNAADYIVKPVNYYDFALKMSRAVRRVPARDAANAVTISTEVGWVRLDPQDIRYAETDGHHVILHTVRGDHRQYGTLSALESQLEPHGFCRCNNCYLVNLRYVSGIKGYTAILDVCELRISQPRKKEFLRRLAEYGS